MSTYTKTYQTKKGTVTKTYTKGEVKMFTSKGAIAKPYLNKVARILGVKEPKPADLLDIKATVQRFIKHYEDQGLAPDIMTPEQAAARYMHNRIEVMLTNTGFTLAELARQANTTVDFLTNEGNWLFGLGTNVFLNEKGEAYTFVFRYNGACFERTDDYVTKYNLE